jgi:hypothetical protein
VISVSICIALRGTPELSVAVDLRTHRAGLQQRF